MACINRRFSKPIEPIRDENGNIMLGRSDSTGGYYASSYDYPPPSPPGSPSRPAPRVSGVPPLARAITDGAGYSFIDRMTCQKPEDAGAAGGGCATPPGYDYGPSVPLPRTVDLAALTEDGPYDPYEHILPEIFTTAEKKLDQVIEYQEKFGHTSKTNAMGLEAFHYMRDNGIECYPPLYPKKKKIMAIISYTDLGY